jgi:hypothetical protein
MFRFFKYDDTGYTDFENSIFSNLNKSQFDSLNDKITIEAVEYRLSSIRELCENCNNTDTINYEIMTMNTRPVHRIITTPGAIGTIPTTNDHRDGSWLPTDLYIGEVLINTSDNLAFIRIGNEIRSWNLNRIVNSQIPQIEFVDPESLTVGSDNTTVNIYGTFLDNITGVDIDNVGFGVIVTNFNKISSDHISIDVDPSQADISPSSGETLNIPFFLNIPLETVNISLSLLAGELPDPIIESIEAYNNPGFIAGEQTVIITGSNLNSMDGLSINPENDMITQLSYEFDDNNYILAQMDIPVELLGTLQSFVLSYDGYMTEPFQVLLTEAVPPPPDLPEITGVTDPELNPVLPTTNDIVISGVNFGTQGTLSIRSYDLDEAILHGPITWTDNQIFVSSCSFSPYVGNLIQIIVTDNTGQSSNTYEFNI